MRTVGQTLKEAREDKLLTLEEVEKTTKIRRELLTALESDDYQKLPPPTFVQGFIKNYAKYLSLDPNRLLALFRREYSEKAHQPYVMDAFIHPADPRKIKITPSHILGIVIAVIILSFFGYLWLQYRQFVGSPTLTVSSPLDQMTTDTPNILVEGKTDPEIKVFVNNQEIAVDSSGQFKKEISLSSPVNKINIEATSKFGQKINIDRTVYLKR